MPPNSFEIVLDEQHAGTRLDVFLAQAIEDLTRSLIQKLIKDGQVTVNGTPSRRPGRSLGAGDTIRVKLPPVPLTTVEPENIPLEILYQDSELIIVNKPSGLVVHPAPGHYTGTMLNAILFHCPDFLSPGNDVFRAGIVHRLDRFTSGLLVVAKTQRALTALSIQARDHAFDRRYLALVRGEFPEDRGRINASVGRSISDPARMSVTGVKARDAVTHFEVLERFGVASLASLVLETGRTHQIRVHLRFAGHPVLGDPTYGVTDYSNWRTTPEVIAALERLEGQALHAERLGITHPVSGERLTFAAPPPPDFQRALDALRASISSPE